MEMSYWCTPVTVHQLMVVGKQGRSQHEARRGNSTKRLIEKIIPRKIGLVTDKTSQYKVREFLGKAF